MPEGILDQALWRRTIKAKDQFEREWAWVVEKRTGDRVGPVNPVGWSDPLHTPQKYLHTPQNANKVEVKFDEWIDDIKKGMPDWLEVLRAAGRIAYKKATPKEVHEEWPNDEYLLNEAGPKPSAWLQSTSVRNPDGTFRNLIEHDADGEPLEEPIAILQRAKAGDLDLLGGKWSGAVVLDDTAPVEVSWPKFKATLIKDGKTDEEISALWTAHKAELEPAEA